mmetsp:Transcript_6009/g.11733  ORF Transcript_6009/g.11733 Transcript_6009/m.11733 type:complete len:129 (+) Transcript_6009:311-697(+)
MCHEFSHQGVQALPTKGCQLYKIWCIRVRDEYQSCLVEVYHIRMFKPFYAVQEYEKSMDPLEGLLQKYNVCTKFYMQKPSNTMNPNSCFLTLAQVFFIEIERLSSNSLVHIQHIINLSFKVRCGIIPL